jgi:hypothetical protein
MCGRIAVSGAGAGCAGAAARAMTAALAGAAGGRWAWGRCGRCWRRTRRVLAADPYLAGHGEAEVRRDAQHVALAAGFEELPQLGAAAVDLVAADEVQADAVGENLGEQVDSQLPFGAERQIRWQPHDLPSGRVLELLARSQTESVQIKTADLLQHEQVTPPAVDQACGRE